VYAALARPAPTPRRSLVAAAFAAWLSVMLGAALTAAQLSLSGTISGGLVFPAMLGVHAVIGMGEAAITTAALGLLWRVRPDLLGHGLPSRAASKRWRIAALAGLTVVALLAPLASQNPDGLERVAEQLGFHGRAAQPAFSAPMPDYTLPGFAERAWAPIVVSLLGAFLLAPVVLLLVSVARRRPGVGAQPRRLDPRVKLACALVVVFSAVLVPAERAGKLWLLLVLALGCGALARLSLKWLAVRAIVLLPLVALAALSAISHEPAGSLIGLAFLRACVCLLAMASFLYGATEPEVLAAMGAVRLPTAVSQTVAFAMRYLWLIGDEARRMMQARAARSVGAGTLALRADAAGGIIGSLFIRSYERAERVAGAMAARGYTPGSAVGVRMGALRVLDVAFGAGFGLVLLGVWLWP